MVVVKRKRLSLIALAVIVVLIVGGIVGFHVAVRVLKGKVVEALGPNSEIRDIRLGWSSVNVEGLRIKGPGGWPADDALRAERVSVVPSLRSLLSRQYHVRSITIVKPYLSALRTKEGKFLVLPGLLTGAGGAGQAATTSSPATASPLVTIGRITLEDGVVEMYDATVGQPPLKIRLEQINATVRDLAVPGLKGKSRFEIAGVVKGVQRDGQLKINGWAEVGTKDSSVKTELRSVDLVVLQPYLIKAGETGVQKGTLDLDLQSDVSNNQMKAPGKATISDLEFVPAGGAFGTFMGLPRQAVVSFLMRSGNKLTVDFVIEGDINNPQFSLNQALAGRLAFSMAKALGVNLGGMVKGVGTLGQKGGEAAGQAAKGAGSLLQKLIGGKKKH
ncbi:MAG: DUF748 domain-containing protein [Candidatus Krumholzibacteriaceae bacterium]|jgi:uncharacterized protein involved in outer membrane biogenesis